MADFSHVGVTGFPVLSVLQVAGLDIFGTPVSGISFKILILSGF